MSSSAPRERSLSAVLGSEALFEAFEGFNSDEDFTDVEDAETLQAAAAARKLCERLAVAVVLREPLPADAAGALRSLPANVRALSLGLVGEEGAWLAHVPVMEEGKVRAGALAPAGRLQAGTAAWEAFRGRRMLTWNASQDGPPPQQYEDWCALLMAHDAHSVATLPLAASDGYSVPLGAANFVMGREPTGAEVVLLQQLAACLALAITHQTKHLWEVSLGFLTQVIPRRVVHKMLSAAMSLGPLAAAAVPRPQAETLAAVAAAAAAGAAARGAAAAAAGASRQPAAVASQPGTPTASPPAGAHCATGSPKALFTAAAVATSGGEGAGAGASQPPSPPLMRGRKAASAPTLTSADAVPAPTGKAASEPAAAAAPPTWQPARGGDGNTGAGVKSMCQKWNLEFVDPLLEDSFKLWFNTMQTRTDLAVCKYFSVLLLVMVAALAARGGTTWGGVLAMTHGLLSLSVLAVLMLANTAWYIAHRSSVVASVRISSAAMLLLHVYMDPGFYSGGLLKGLAGSCAFTLIINSFRTRLRFSNHVLVQLAKLYFCAMANAFIFSDSVRASHTYLPLVTTTAVQLLAALIPSLAVYRLEKGMRREFLRPRLAAAGQVQGDPPAPATQLPGGSN